jgi:hypothetical protein
MSLPNSAQTFPIARPLIRKRLFNGLVLALLVGVEAAWLSAVVAGAVLLLSR